ncbi:MAG: cytochrome P450 [Betaproteobacteria bacterium]|nr:cytochrome P450 [Betaproteobacteria bacterium]
MSVDYRPDDPAFLADPFPLFRRLQDEDPCHWSPRLKAWVLTRYEDVRRVCLDRAMSSERLRPFFAALPPPEAQRIADIVRYLSLWMVFRDPPQHTRLRRLTSKVFHVKSMHAMRPRIEALMHWLFDRIGARREFDFIDDFAGPLPALVIMDMLGVPTGELARVKRLSDDMALFIGSSRMSADKYAIAEAATREMAAYFRDLIALRRVSPRTDLLTELVHLEDDGDRLSDDELVATCILLLFAGHETTTNHIANGLLGLMRFPEQMHKLRADPSLAAAAIEELLRYDGPNGAQVRIVQQAQELHGKTLRPGERVFIMLNAANRDARAYADPDRVDIARDGPPHLAFGFGAHICLGFPLARLEGQIALPAVLARWPGLALADGRPAWLNSMVFRGMTSMPVRVPR